MTDKSIFQRPLWVSIFALTAAIVWGWAYPLIKLGFVEFAITPDMTGSNYSVEKMYHIAEYSVEKM